MENHGWNWNLVKKESWKSPCEEFFFLVERWKSKNFERILDIGCGKGRHTLGFTQCGFKTVGVDISPSSIEMTKELLNDHEQTADVLMADFLNLPFPDKSFDCVFSYLTITHSDTKGVKKAFSEINRVLKNGGEIFVTLNSVKSNIFINKKNKMLDEHTFIKEDEGPEKGELHFYADDDITIELLNGFDIIWLRLANDIFHNSKRYGAWHYLALAKKEDVSG
jgi:ubiquinone/menaquinone biosynthesis C-methylase UbiE